MTSFEQALQALAHLSEPGNTRVLAIGIRLATLEGRGDTRPLSTAASATCPSPKETWSTPSKCWSKAWPFSCLQQPLLIRHRPRRAWALPMHSRGVWREGRALLEEAISEGIRIGSLQGYAHRVAWLSKVCRLAGHGDEAWQHARQALDLARQLKRTRGRGTGAAPAWRRPCPRHPRSCRAG